MSTEVVTTKPAGDHSNLISKFVSKSISKFLENPMPRPLLFWMNKEKGDGRTS